MHRRPEQSSPRLLLVAIAAALATCGNANAQYRIDPSHTNDANNRIGSGGSNDAGGQAGPGVTADNIFYGNVTRGFGFRGNLSTRDPRAFGDRLPTNDINAFLRNSTGLNEVLNSPNNYAPQPYYPIQNAAPPPPGFEYRPGIGGYVPSAPAPVQPQPYDSRLNYRLDVPNSLPKPGELALPGQVDPRADRPGVLQPANGSSKINPPTFDSTAAPSGAPIRLDPATLDAVRRELPQDAGSDLPTDKTKAPQPGVVSKKEAPKYNGFEIDPRQSLAPRAIGEDVTSHAIAQQPLDYNAVTLGMIAAEKSGAAPAVKQSKQYAAMRDRLDELYTARLKEDKTFSDAVARLQKARKARSDTAGPSSAPATPESVGIVDYGRMSRELVEQSRRRDRAISARQPVSEGGFAEPPKPVEVSSLASGVEDTRLEKTLAEAEKLMNAGQWAKALNAYDLAVSLAPNYGPTWLGKAHAELGFGYYNRADEHIRQALSADPTLLMGRYDLLKMMGQERVSFIVRDLKDLATKQPTEPRPLFLLAYLAYNTGYEKAAADYLARAEELAGARDPFYRLVRQHWRLTDATTKPAK